MPDRACDSDPCEIPSSKGNYLVAWFKNCYNKLIRNPSIRNASIPIQLTENNVELRDGSVNFPIRLPALQKTNAQSVSTILIVLADGTIQQWNAAGQSGKKRVVVNDGVFTFVDDYSSDLFDANMCSGDCTDIDGIIGYKEIPIVCPGQPDRKAIQLWKIPACCAGEVDDA